MEISADSHVPENPRRITRARARHRCMECARRRVRCDLQQPCGACRNAHLECIRQDNTHLKKARASSELTSSRSPKDHFVHLERLIDEIVMHNGPRREFPATIEDRSSASNNAILGTAHATRREYQYVNPLSWEAIMVSITKPVSDIFIGRRRDNECNFHFLTS